MKPYIGIVHQDERSAYGITFPDAPGCFSASDTLDEIFAKAEEALGLWIGTMMAERLATPQPRDLSDLKGDPAWTTSFADAALVIAVPSPSLLLPAAA